MTARGLGRSQAIGPSGDTNVREVVFAMLREYGMTTVFGNPGSTELPMFRDLPQDFRYVLGLQEGAVLGMADGFAQATRNAALVNLHSSAGVGHALGNLFTAFRNQTPLVVTAGQQARSILPFEPFLYAERPTEFPQPFVKWSVEPARAEDVPWAIARAYHIAMQAPCGPTFVSIPIDDWDRPCDPIPLRRVSRTVSADPALLAEVKAMLSRAERPVVVAGAGVARDRAFAPLVALAEAHDMPVWAAPMAARNVFPEDHRLFAGFLAAAREAVVRDLAGHDLVLVLGAPAFTYHVEGFGPFVPDGADLVTIVDDPAMAARVPAGLAVVGSVRAAVETLAEVARPATRAAAPLRDPAPRPDPARLTDALLLERLAALRPAGTVMVEEAPSTRGPLHDHYPIQDADGFYTCASGGLGHGMPAAVGVALARPEATVIALIGDGSAMYTPQAIWTAAELALDVRFVIVNNGAYAALEQFGRIFDIEVVGSRLPGIDFVKLAEAQRVPAARVDTAADLDAALQSLLGGHGPRLLEVVVETTPA